MASTPVENEHLVEQFDLLGHHLAELHDRIDPDDLDSLDALQGAVQHHNELAKIIDPEAMIEWPSECPRQAVRVVDGRTRNLVVTVRTLPWGDYSQMSVDIFARANKTPSCGDCALLIDR